jgi:hypothetical protein
MFVYYRLNAASCQIQCVEVNERVFARYVRARDEFLVHTVWDKDFRAAHFFCLVTAVPPFREYQISIDHTQPLGRWAKPHHICGRISVSDNYAGEVKDVGTYPQHTQASVIMLSRHSVHHGVSRIKVEVRVLMQW